METLRDIAVHLSSQIGAMNAFEVVSDGTDIPVLAFKVVDPDRFTVFQVMDHLRMNGWQVPAYTLPDDATDVAVLRIVVREGFSMDLAALLLEDLATTVDALDEHGPSASENSRFSHT